MKHQPIVIPGKDGMTRKRLSFETASFFIGNGYVFVLQLISTTANPIRNGTVYVS